MRHLPKKVRIVYAIIIGIIALGMLSVGFIY